MPNLQQEVDNTAELLDGVLLAANQECTPAQAGGVGRLRKYSTGHMGHSVASARAKQAALTQQLVEMLAAAERENVEMRRSLGQQPQIHA